MPKPKKIPNYNENLLIQKVEAKLIAIRNYCSGAEPTFTVPPCFTLTWFAELSENGLEEFSRSGKSMRVGHPLRLQIEEDLSTAESYRKKSKAQKKSDIEVVKRLKEQVRELKDKLAQTEMWLMTRTNENHELRRQLKDERTMREVQAAQLRQKNSVVKSLVRPRPKEGGSPVE